MGALDEFACAKLDQAEERALRRSLADTAATGPGQRVVRDGRALISFCSNDYLGLAQHPALKAAAKQAIDEHGAGAGASRLVTGNHPLYRTLEAKLAALKQTEAAIVFGSGYLTNVGVIPALVGPGDVILADELSHSCLMSGARLSGARLVLFRHNDVDELRALLNAHRSDGRHCLIVTEGVFSMDGDLAPLAEIAEVAKTHDAWLMTDDAHGFGVPGGGRGSAAEAGVKPDVQMGTLSKAVGSYGGYVCASRAVIDLLVSRARSLIYATALPPSAVAAAIAGVDLIASDPTLCARPLAHARAFARALDLPAPQSSIVPLILGRPEDALDASRVLEDEGFLVVAIRPPTVPEGTARLRFSFAADHAIEDVLRLSDVVARRILKSR
ncbi:MAG: 8-amino-7-oxononanoate synthase [Alphaproteobacteria bacterium]|nr:8-amino-7-oxononanoate synthase [Alphaproteobacteria bacterium]